MNVRECAGNVQLWHVELQVNPASPQTHQPQLPAIILLSLSVCNSRDRSCLSLHQLLQHLMPSPSKILLKKALEN